MAGLGTLNGGLGKRRIWGFSGEINDFLLELGGGFRPIISLFGFRSLRNYEKIGVFKKMTFFSESDS